MKQSFLKTKNILVLILYCMTTTHTVCAKEEFEISPIEDLMREHGILNRILLIYEEIIKTIDTPNFQPTTLQNTLDILQTFIENYHEKLEETYIFPLFEKNKKEVQLITTLKNQHNKGRVLTTKLQKLARKTSLNQKDKKRIKKLLQKFITMYRPHEAREDTVIFPQVRSLLSEKEFKELGEIFEDLEHKLFGKEGFETTVHKVAAIEKQLNIYTLEQFTPVIQ